MVQKDNGLLHHLFRKSGNCEQKKNISAMVFDHTFGSVYMLLSISKYTWCTVFVY